MLRFAIEPLRCRGIIVQSRLLSSFFRRGNSFVTSPSTYIHKLNDAIVNARKPRYKRSQMRQSGAQEQDAAKINGESSNEHSNGSSEGGGDDERRKRAERIVASARKWLLLTLLLFGVSYTISMNPDVNTDKPNQGAVKNVSWTNFINNVLMTGAIQQIKVYPGRQRHVAVATMVAEDKDGKPLVTKYCVAIPSVLKLEAEVRAVESILALPPDRWVQIEVQQTGNHIARWFAVLLTFTIAFGSIALLRRAARSGGFKDFMSKMTAGKYTVIDPHSVEGKKLLKIKFKDVAGCNEAKVEVSEFVDYLKNPNKYTKLGAKLPKGALLTGPPGCGKTLMAKALAAESTAPFISMNGSEFIEVIGGLGASRIRGLFKEARSRAPCIIYIDEIDAIGKKRSEGAAGTGGSSREEEQTLNQLLVEMDGMGSEKGIVVLASTNRPDILDKALLRPGRFDRHISIDLPTVAERKEIFELYLQRIKRDFAVNKYSQRLAQMTPGFSGADINNVVNESAIRAAALGDKTVNIDHLHYALDRVLAGAEKRSKTLVAEEREIVAYHEAGHALVGWLLEHTDALLKVTIIPRTSAALGFAQYSPRDKKLFTSEELFDRMCMMLGGRAAENLKFGRTTTGAQDDLKKVTRSAYAQVRMYGMSSVVGPLSFQGGDDFAMKPYSKRFGNMLDQEASVLAARAYASTEELIKGHLDKLETIAQALLKREVLTYEEVKALIGPPLFGEKHAVDLVDSVLPKDDASA